MTVINIAIIVIGLVSLPAAYRMVVGPTNADRVVSADLLIFATVGLLALFGIRGGSNFTFDVVLVTSLVGFLGALSLARALLGGRR